MKEEERKFRLGDKVLLKPRKRGTHKHLLGLVGTIKGYKPALEGSSYYVVDFPGKGRKVIATSLLTKVKLLK
jgi:hypothetical protein